MQMARQEAHPVLKHGIATRFALVRGYFLDHVGVSAYTPVFIAVDPELKQHEDKIRQWWNSRALVSDMDADIIARMERVVEVLKNAKSVA